MLVVKTSTLVWAVALTKLYDVRRIWRVPMSEANGLLCYISQC